jgi:2-methylcitrate dehydratase PrpD
VTDETAADTAPRTVAEVLAARALQLRSEPFDAALGAAARKVFVDWLGVTLGGATQAPAAALVAGLAPADGMSRILGWRENSLPSVAALINATSAHTLELDDIYAPGLFHPGAPIIGAALAVADQLGAPLGMLWRAIVIGYEMGCRVAADLGPAHYAHWHTTGTAGAIGAAAAASEIRAASAAEIVNALALAATMCGGLQQTFRTDAMGKPLHSGAAAQAGVVAAAAAAGGVTGAPDVFEGPAGLGAATGAPSDWAHSRAPLRRPLAVEAITVKPYPCCGHAFAPIDAVLQLRAGGVSADAVARLEVHTYSTAIDVAGIRVPTTDAERRFSIPYLVATALTRGSTGLADPLASQDGTIRRLQSEVDLAVDDQIERRFPARRGARVIAVSPSGVRAAVEVPDRSGSPENPLRPAAIEEKFLTTTAAQLGDKGRELLDRIAAAPAALPVRELDIAG